MSEVAVSIYLIVMLIFWLASGLWIGLALALVGYLGMLFFTGRPIGDSMVMTIWGSMSSWTLTALPMFIWMGEILFRTRLSEDIFKGVAPWVEKIPGKLLHVNIIACTIFAAVSGSSAATTATIGKITIPELMKRGYPEEKIIGTLAGAGTLGFLIPPSIIMIVYGVSANVSIAKLFVAGVIPGISLALMFMIYIALWSIFYKNGLPEDRQKYSFGDKIKSTKNLILPILLIVAVLGSIYTGVATATEAAGIGVLGSLVIAFMQGTLNWKTFSESLLSATRLYAMIALILAGSSFLSLSMGFIGLPRHIAEVISSLNLSPQGLIVVLTVFYIILGMFIDGISMVVLTISVLLPSITQAGIDLIWFGVFLVIVVELAQITPPVGFNLFVIQGLTGKDLGYIAKQSLPAFIIMCFLVLIIFVYPDIVLYLPNKMRG
ncbi:TRAP transporter large permease [Calditerrivibrio sp.]|jgi:tripartite ATP-independent transporter DctM subunit|uniref:TRAP transporter large permease n=1 Tax=Calditerrivibrio sp. TaxID=2792612 RepID=UPI003D11D265